MSSDLDKSDEGPETVAQKLDGLSASVDKRFASVDERFNAVDERFNAVDAALIEQREYTEFAFDKLAKELRGEMGAGFARIESRFDKADRRADSVDGHLNRFERKLDRFIDTQSKTNELVERRLSALEPRSAQE